MKRKFLQRRAVVVMLIWFAVVAGCSSNRCRCSCHNQTTRLAHVRHHPPVVETAEIRRMAPAMDDANLSTKPVARSDVSLRARQNIDRKPLQGHGGTYEWLYGVLNRVRTPEKGWELRYVPLDVRERLGGNMVVAAADVPMSQFEEGDNVYVEGEIIDDRESPRPSRPRYRVRAIRLVEDEDYRRVWEELSKR